MPSQKKTRLLASRCAGVTIPELEQSKAAVLSTTGVGILPPELQAIRGSGNALDIASQALIEDVRKLIVEARRTVASTVNATLTMLYWRIGRRVIDETLRGKRAAYGQQIVVSLARQLVQEYAIGREIRLWTVDPYRSGIVRVTREQ